MFSYARVRLAAISNPFNARAIFARWDRGWHTFHLAHPSSVYTSRRIAADSWGCNYSACQSVKFLVSCFLYLLFLFLLSDSFHGRCQHAVVWKVQVRRENHEVLRFQRSSGHVSRIKCLYMFAFADRRPVKL